MSFWDQGLDLKDDGEMEIMSTGRRISFKEEGNIPARLEGRHDKKNRPCACVSVWAVRWDSP